MQTLKGCHALMKVTCTVKFLSREKEVKTICN